METDLGQLIGGAMHLDRAAFEAIQLDPHGLRDALLVLVLAGASETLGQCVVLILNRVSRLRFCLAILLGGLELAVEALLWIFSMWLVVGWLGVDRPSLASAARVIGLAYAPLLLGFFVFLPYLGPLLARVLRVWALLAAVVGTSVAFGISPLAAAFAAGVGFLIRWLLLAAFGQIGRGVNRLIRRPSTGQLTLQSADRNG
jgi:hypothetical protein